MLSETFLAGVAGVGPLFFLFMAIQQAIHRDISIDSGRCSTSVERIAHPIIAEWTTVTIVLSLLLLCAIWTQTPC